MRVLSAVEKRSLTKSPIDNPNVRFCNEIVTVRGLDNLPCTRRVRAPVTQLQLLNYETAIPDCGSPRDGYFPFTLGARPHAFTHRRGLFSDEGRPGRAFEMGRLRTSHSRPLARCDRDSRRRF